jgi:F0F1-type ATP synthase membrane subunit b/b'
VLTAVVTSSGADDRGHPVGRRRSSPPKRASEAAGPESDLNPIFPEVKEVVWGFGAFVVLALVMRLFLFRKVRDGMTARYDRIEGDLEYGRRRPRPRPEPTWPTTKPNSQRSASTRRPASRRHARRSRAERTEQIAAANARIADKRGAAAAEVDAAKQAARGQVESAVADVSTRLSELATGRRPERRGRAASCRRGNEPGGVGMSLFTGLHTSATLAAGHLIPARRRGDPLRRQGLHDDRSDLPAAQGTHPGHDGVDHRVQPPGLEGRTDHSSKSFS